MKINVPHIAKLANLPLKDEEKNKFEKQLSEILSYVDKLQKIDTKDVKESNGSKNNVSREDITSSSLSQEDTLSNSKSKQNGLFKVNRIL